jgi:hypothetical protein
VYAMTTWRYDAATNTRINKMTPIMGSNNTNAAIPAAGSSSIIPRRRHRQDEGHSSRGWSAQLGPLRKITYPGTMQFSPGGGRSGIS